jgi:hypothetical protein
VTVKSYGPTALGVPMILPEWSSTDRKADDGPVSVNVGSGKPSADTDAETGTFACNEPSEANTTVGTVPDVSTVPLKIAEAVAPNVFEAVILTEKGPVAVCPLIFPVPSSRTKPPGKAPPVTANVDAGEPSADSEMETTLPVVTDPELESAVGAL